MGASRFFPLLRYNAKLMLNLNILAAVILIVISPGIFSFTLISSRDMAKVCEFYLSTCGIMLFSYLNTLEKGGIEEIVYTKKLPHIVSVSVRLVMAAALAALMISLVLALALYQGGSFGFWDMSFGTIATALYLGVIAFTASNLAGSLSTGYLIAFAYYVFEFSTKGKYTGAFYLFSLLSNRLDYKYNLLAAAGGLLIINFIILYKKS